MALGMVVHSAKNHQPLRQKILANPVQVGVQSTACLDVQKSDSHMVLSQLAGHNAHADRTKMTVETTDQSLQAVAQTVELEMKTGQVVAMVVLRTKT